MTKEELVAKGLTEEQVKFVMDSLSGDFVTMTRFKEVNEENKQLKAQITERDGQLESLKKSSGDNAALQEQITALQTANAEQKKAHDAEIKQLKLDNAIENALVAAGARNATAVKSLLDTSKFKLSESGEVEGLADGIKAVQKSDPYLFVEKQQQQQNNFKGFQPGASGDQKPNTEVDTSKMTYSEMVAYLEKNPDAKLD